MTSKAKIPPKVHVELIRAHLRHLRESKNISLAQLERDIDCVRNRFMKIENGDGNVCMFQVLKALEYMGLTMNEFMTMVDETYDKLSADFDHGIKWSRDLNKLCLFLLRNNKKETA